jgi:hypothetical protein
MVDEVKSDIVIQKTDEVPQMGGRTGLKLELVARDGDGNITGTYCNENDLITQQFAQFAILNIFNQLATLTVTDTTNTARSIVGTPATITALTIVGGTGATAASVTDYVIQTAASTTGTSSTVAATVNWVVESSGVSGSFTITGTFTNTSGSTITYSELALYVTNAAHLFAITHDVFTGVAVSNTGTLAITYTLTNS